MHVLIIEDDLRTLSGMRQLLENRQMAVETASLGKEGLGVALQKDHDLILLDLGLPDMHGFDVLKKLRGADNDTPVMILSGTADVEAKTKGLRMGADDYIVKPFQAPELLARISAVVRRSNGHSHSMVRFGGLTVNLDAQWVECRGARIHLSRKEYAIVELLALRKGQVVTRDMFVSHLYGGRDAPDEKIIEVFISKIRKKFETVLDGDGLIETVWGQGYMIRDPEQAGDVDADIPPCGPKHVAA